METFDRWPLLSGVSSPADVRALPADKMPELAAEIRDYLVYRTGENGGHLASNLGVVELTLALHRVFDAPRDHILFDVGHQSYVHKLLTERKEFFDTLRCPGGLSGFTKRAEGEYDAFGAGHSSTAVSAALGLAVAEAKKGSDAYTVAVVGDGALTGGLSYEGLNNCPPDLKLILIINENEMSISRNTGHLAGHLSKIRASHRYLKTKEFASGTLTRLPLVGKPLYRFFRWIKRSIKYLFYRENLFEHMGIRYLGPVEGNDVASLVACLQHAKKLNCSVLLHVKTQKGKGYAPAEKDPNAYHALCPRGAVKKSPCFARILGDELVRLAAADPRILAITAAMGNGTGLEDFRKTFPDRFFDVGIAEGHAVTFAAGLAAGGEKPVFAVYSTFLQRAYDNVLHDAALQNLPLVLCVDHAGFNEHDGVTHHGIFDVAMLSGIPNVRIFAPVSAMGLRVALSAALSADGVSVLRYPAGGENEEILAAFYPDGTATTPGVRAYGAERENAALTIVTHGRIAAEALAAARALTSRGTPTRVLLCEYITPYLSLAADVAEKLGGDVIFLEEEVRAGGFGMNLADALCREGKAPQKYTILAAENAFLTPKKGESYLAAAGLDAAAIVRAAENMKKTGGKDHAES